jgi:histidinol-phosphate aminotransferase
VDPLNEIRPNIRAMSGYTPGEQPTDWQFIKLNTNENPYPPSPKVFDAIRAALTGDRLRKYPDPSGKAFRETAGRVLGVDPDAILIGNGSDDDLTILTRCFVPEGGLIVSPTPSYLLYKTLADIQGARYQSVPFTPDWKLPAPWPVRGASMTFLANPNSPSGTMLGRADLERWVDQVGGPVVLDEAYVDFAEGHALYLTKKPNVIVTRSFSKSYALAGIRFGFAVADPAVIRQLTKVKDSYNCDVLSLAAAIAAIEDQGYLRQSRDKIIATRQRMTAELRRLGFEVTPSQANFVWCRRSDPLVSAIYEGLKKRMILVRLMRYDGYGEGLRISVGSDAEVDRLLEELRTLM